ncbi:MAG: cytochrome-c oxidase, cbb3-type subunit III [Chromatiales bacterium]|nr:cytochrome-c oxidase, cbb3-type subunit III [Gammaproteobacteria bacterium]MBW6477386.1 cytochrome-c oxidase, cbb3-type subunit III [Chromatiales bacterium]
MSEKSNPYSAPDTGHVWDDNLRELTNQPPKWWWIGLHASWIFVLLYSILYPTWPMINTHTKGILGWTAIQEFKEGKAVIEEKRSVYEERLQGMSATAIIDDEELRRYVMASSKVLFGDNCAACHGVGGQGNPNFPRLNNDDWLWGGNVQAIQTTITNGRKGMMPAHGHLSETEVSELANAIVAGSPTRSGLFMEKGCFACHGMDGTGNPMLGAPNLTNGIWRFESRDQLASVMHTIRHGVNDPNDARSRDAEMPAFGERLSKDEITKLTVYVHQLGGGQ